MKITSLAYRSDTGANKGAIRVMIIRKEEFFSLDVF
jgi:hypothetical protein